MDKDIVLIHIRLKHNKIVIFAIVVFLTLLTFGLIVFSQNISNEQAMTYQSRADFLPSGSCNTKCDIRENSCGKGMTCYIGNRLPPPYEGVCRATACLIEEDCDCEPEPKATLIPEPNIISTCLSSFWWRYNNCQDPGLANTIEFRCPGEEQGYKKGTENGKHYTIGGKQIFCYINYEDGAYYRVCISRPTEMEWLGTGPGTGECIPKRSFIRAAEQYCNCAEFQLMRPSITPSFIWPTPTF